MVLSGAIYRNSAKRATAVGLNGPCGADRGVLLLVCWHVGILLGMSCRSGNRAVDITLLQQTVYDASRLPVLLHGAGKTGPIFVVTPFVSIVWNFGAGSCTGYFRCDED